jgi:hypothetical protein
MGHCVDGSGCCALGALFVESHAMGLLTFGLNVTLDECIDHTQGILRGFATKAIRTATKTKSRMGALSAEGRN